MSRNTILFPETISNLDFFQYDKIGQSNVNSVCEKCCEVSKTGFPGFTAYMLFVPTFILKNT